MHCLQVTPQVPVLSTLPYRLASGHWSRRNILILALHRLGLLPSVQLRQLPLINFEKEVESPQPWRVEFRQLPLTNNFDEAAEYPEHQWRVGRVEQQQQQQ